jgi:CheY-like chemotaxis protein
MVTFQPDGRSGLPYGPASPSPVAARTLATANEPRPDAPPVVLTARALLVSRPALVDTLRGAHYLVRIAPAWDQLLDAIEGHPVDAVLVDLDAVDRGQRGHIFDMSGHRLVSLLARLSPTRRFALMVQTALDFAEIQDLVRLGTHGLFGPDLADEELVPQIRGALRRVHAPRRQDRARRREPVPALATATSHWPPELAGLGQPAASGDIPTL